MGAAQWGLQERICSLDANTNHVWNTMCVFKMIFMGMLNRQKPDLWFLCTDWCGLWAQQTVRADTGLQCWCPVQHTLHCSINDLSLNLPVPGFFAPFGLLSNNYWTQKFAIFGAAYSCSDFTTGWTSDVYIVCIVHTSNCTSCSYYVQKTNFVHAAAL